MRSNCIEYDLYGWEADVHGMTVKPYVRYEPGAEWLVSDSGGP